MKRMTDRYFQAMQAGAQPFILAFLTTDFGARCLAKTMPDETLVGSTVEHILEWKACVKNFGTYRQAASQESDDILALLSETEMSNYTLTCLEQNNYWREICAREQMINGDLALYQGFHWPDFAFADCIALYYGKVTRYELTYEEISIISRQVAIVQFPEVPTVTLTATYGDDFDDTGWGIAIDSNGNVYVTDKDADHVKKFNSAGELQATFGSSGTGNGEFDTPLGIAVDSNDYIYVVDSGNERVQKFNSSGTYQAQWSAQEVDEKGMVTMGGIAIDKDDRIYVGEDAFIQEYTTAGVHQGEVHQADDWNHVYPAKTPDGTLWGAYTQMPEHPLSRISLVRNGRTFRSHPPVSLDTPRGLAYAASLMWVCDSGNDRLVLFDDSVNQVATFGSSGTGNGEFDTPTDIVFNAAQDTFWVVDSGNARVQKFTFTVSGTSVEDGMDTELTVETEFVSQTAGNYTNYGDNQQNVILPHVYGDMTENSDQGAWVCPEIDTVNHVFAVAAWPVLSVANGNSVSVYVDGTLQTSGYTFDENNDYESKGAIAILTFTSDPGGTVTVKCKGKDSDGDGTGTLLTNPVDIIEDWLDYVIDLLDRDSWSHDANNFAQAENQCDNNGFSAAGVFQSNNQLGWYLQTILNSFWGAFRFNGDGEIQLFFKPLVESSKIYQTLQEYDLHDLTVTKDLSSIVNRVVINYAVSYAQIDRRFKNGGDPSYFRTADDTSGTDTNSIQKYGDQSLTLNFDWNRDTTSIENLQEAMLAAFNDPEFIVSCTTQRFDWLPLELLDQVQATLSLVRGQDNSLTENVIYEIREKTTNLDDFTTSLLLYSLNVLDLADRLGGVDIGDDAVYIGEHRVYFLNFEV